MILNNVVENIDLSIKNRKLYYICSDESMYNLGRYRSICSITFPYDNATILHNQLKEIITECSLTEFKWNKCKGDSNYRKCACKFIDWSLQQFNNIFIDIIIWDTQDSRHNIKHRDDNKNFSMMYGKLLNYRISRMEKNSWFELYPDEKNGFNWNTLKSYLSYWNDLVTEEVIQTYLKTNSWDLNKVRETIKNIKSVDSKICVFNQLADFWTGFAAFTYNECQLYKMWLNNENGQISLFPCKIELTRSQKTRFNILKYFDEHKYKPNNIKLDKGLRTYIGKTHDVNLNFWLYTPQTHKDKAPIKQP